MITPMFERIRDLTDAAAPIRAPLVLNPLMAKLAEKAGFEAVYLGGGGLGYQKVFLEANLSLTEVAHAGLEISSATSLPILADVACGWGDPMHVYRSVKLLEASGFAGMELEDQLFPKRAHHHVGKDHAIPPEEMEAKIRAAVQARRDPDFVIIARTDAARRGKVDEALQRCEAYRAAGADVLLPAPGFTDPEVISAMAERLGPPLMFLTPPGGLAEVGMTLEELHAVGFRIVVDAFTLHMLVYEVLKAGYDELANNGFAIRPDRTQADWYALVDDMHGVIDLETLLEIERNTVEHD
jgi:2-methylisocitrate lyase-like PEP mutase family enzyme